MALSVITFPMYPACLIIIRLLLKPALVKNCKNKKQAKNAAIIPIKNPMIKFILSLLINPNYLVVEWRNVRLNQTE